MIYPKKRFSQNFLNNKKIIQRFVEYLAIEAQDNIIEIGGGTGNLTEGIINNIAAKNINNINFTVLEIDRDLYQLLSEKFKDNNINIYLTDALKFDFNKINHNKNKLTVIGNLPYHISSLLLLKFIENINNIKKINIMLQKEFVDRLIAEPNTKNYGRLTILINYFFDIKKLFIVKKNNFYPVPQIDSAVIQLTPWEKSPIKIDNLPLFLEIVKQAFQQRRKTLYNSLKNFQNINNINIKNSLEVLNIDLKVRAENLSLQNYANIANLLNKN